MQPLEKLAEFKIATALGGNFPQEIVSPEVIGGRNYTSPNQQPHTTQDNAHSQQHKLSDHDLQRIREISSTHGEVRCLSPHDQVVEGSWGQIAVVVLSPSPSSPADDQMAEACSRGPRISPSLRWWLAATMACRGGGRCGNGVLPLILIFI